MRQEAISIYVWLRYDYFVCLLWIIYWSNGGDNIMYKLNEYNLIFTFNNETE